MKMLKVVKKSELKILKNLIIFLLSFQIQTNLNSQILNEKFSLKTTSLWQDLGEQNIKTCNIKEKRALIFELIFRSKKVLNLKKITLKWSGEHIENIAASLYQKKEYDPLMLIEKYFVSDGIWNKKKQEFTFLLDEKLVAINKYFLVLNFAKQFEERLKNGRFNLQNDNAIKICYLQ
ncbi:TPA: hypothetical protein DEO28_01915 [Candidatus Dependentiae bacterium]|nr:MAG: hypothetical protein UR14_C0004G0068 [candidate division TM6 bacterium GW2011_GWE2_31_21]KKP52987.1 MAG: hypothetical protein UR43_C0008G0069 [candidate division TM6 bacterium GW2011_GWF2_33_332]HBS47775.1 hypothetical protein [Candidatus Dependentiae bacterium]HBZ73249.1 hypothetical protein [Candidatus Dependentiae bacterium]